jgi:hypothetical protein
MVVEINYSKSLVLVSCIASARPWEEEPWCSYLERRRKYGRIESPGISSKGNSCYFRNLSWNYEREMCCCFHHHPHQHNEHGRMYGFPIGAGGNTGVWYPGAGYNDRPRYHNNDMTNAGNTCNRISLLKNVLLRRDRGLYADLHDDQ